MKINRRMFLAAGICFTAAAASGVKPKERQRNLDHTCARRLRKALP